jgi:hypothetical protein
MRQTNNTLVFGRYSREECGLPAVPARPMGKGGFFMRLFFLFVCLVLAGWVAGVFAARHREAWMETLPALVHQAQPNEISALLAKGRLYATALGDRQKVRDDLALALLIAAEKSPGRMGYYGNLVQLYALPRDPDGLPQHEFAAELTAGGVFTELKRYDDAFAALARADKALGRYPDGPEKQAHRLLLVNAQAYCLATAPLRAGGNPEKALHLSQLLVSSRDTLLNGGHASDQAAFLDTLASAWFAAGEADKAADTQRLALGLADANGLDAYLEHYDMFTQAGAKR